MLWYKAWLDTRWRFAIGLVVLACVGASTIVDYTATQKLMPLAGAIDTHTAIGRRLQEAIAVQQTFRGFVWWQWFRQNLAQIGTIFAVLLGSGGLVAATEGAALYTLSMPATRAQLVRARAVVGFAEILIMIFAASLVIPATAPAVGERYGLADTLIHGLCAFAGIAAFFSLALLLSAAFDDLWRPLLIACAAAILVGAFETVAWDTLPYGVFHLMSGDTYFQSGRVPWISMLAAAAASAALLAGAASTLAHREF
jgi:hypothetical protein